MELSKNCLLEWNENGSRWLERVLFVDVASGSAVFVRMDLKALTKRSWPFWRTAEEIKSAAKNITVLEKDPYRRAPVDPAHMKTKAGQRWEKWCGVIDSIVANPAIFGSRHQRRGIVAKVSKSSGLDRTLIYRQLWKYWKGGQTPQCLLPDGKPEKTRQFKGGKKRGRKSALEQETGKQIGIAITAEVESKICEGIKQFYTGENTLWDAYVFTLAHHFHAGYEEQDKVLVPIVKDRAEIPTYDQFLRIYYKHRDARAEGKAREGEKSFNLKGRAIFGKSETAAFGPGVDAQIDWTTADIYLLSDHDPDLIVGRPIIYAMKDVWGRFFYSVAVTFLRPGYWSAALALENALVNKVEYCGQYGLTIEPDQWAVDFLPENVRVDNGELSSNKARHLIRGLSMDISILPPYRGDLKGIIERQFGLMNRNLISLLDGALPRLRQPGEKPSPMDAVLTVSQFRRLVLEAIIKYHGDTITDYHPSEDMIAARVALTPMSLLNWGLKYRKGGIIRFPIEKARLHLLPGGTATVKPDGIEFQKLFYTCDRAVTEGWFEKARRWGNYKISVCYDPRIVDRIFLRGPKTTELESLVLMEKSLPFRGWPWAEVEEYIKQRRVDEAEQEQRELQSEVRLKSAAKQISAQAKKKRKAYLRDNPGASKTAELRRLPENQAEQRRYDQRASIEQSKAQQGSEVPPQEKVIPFPNPPQPPPSMPPKSTEVPSSPRSSLDSALEAQLLELQKRRSHRQSGAQPS